MKRIGFILIVISFLSVIFTSQLKLVNQQSQEFDEGVYLTTFLLIDKGHLAYKETFLSQPPGFLLSTYPGFVFFGKTLEAARLTIGLWSIIGLLAIVWICIELKNKWAGVFTLGTLYFLPYYFDQTLVFHSDLLITTFSLITLGFIFRYINTNKIIWFTFAAFFINLSFWTKYDFFLIPALFVMLLILIITKKLNFSKIIRLLSVFISVSILFFLIFILPFGIQSIIKDTLGLRLDAAHVNYSQSLAFFEYIWRDFPLALLTAGAIVITFLKKDSFRFPLLPLLVWTLTVSVIFIFYKPLFIHHMVIYAVPLVLYFSISLVSLLKKRIRFYPLIISFFALLVLINYLSLTSKKTTNILSSDQQKAIVLINNFTNKNESIVTDDGILSGASNRLPPPELSDLSSVRINSNNLSPEQFKRIIDKEKPKLIIPWNGRLNSMVGFNDILEDYSPLETINGKTLHIRMN